MTPKQKNEDKVKRRQKIFYLSLCGAVIIPVGLLLFFTGNKKQKEKREPPPNQFEIVSKDVNADNVRLSNLETLSDAFQERVHSLEKNLFDLKEEKSLIERDKDLLKQETDSLKVKLHEIEEQKSQAAIATHLPPPIYDEEIEPDGQFRAWQCEENTEDRNVLFEIPAGTVVKAILVSGADCSVAVQKPTGPNMVLLRPLDNGKLPKRVKVPLKGSVIIGNAIGDLSSERVYIRAERMTLVQKSGDFIETEVTAYISGEDGREGMRGVVVDRSGQMIARAAFAAFLQGVGQTVQATLNNQVIEKLARVSADKSILNLDMLRNGAFQGGSTALTKISDYMIKRAEQLQPAIQIAAGRVVDIVFTKSVRVGENALKKKLEHERELKRRDHA